MYQSANEINAMKYVVNMIAGDGQKYIGNLDKSYNRMIKVKELMENTSKEDKNEVMQSLNKLMSTSSIPIFPEFEDKPN